MIQNYALKMSSDLTVTSLISEDQNTVPLAHQGRNASLALHVANYFLQKTARTKLSHDAAMETLKRVYWPGRNQLFHWEVPGIDFYLDGAHTIESIAASKLQTRCLHFFRLPAPHLGRTSPHDQSLNFLLFSIALEEDLLIPSSK